jgi:hypothetical protein
MLHKCASREIRRLYQLQDSPFISLFVVSNCQGHFRAFSLAYMQVCHFIIIGNTLWLSDEKIKRPIPGSFPVPAKFVFSSMFDCFTSTL